MNILLLSDTHGLQQDTLDVIARHPHMDAYIHLGDVGFDRKTLSPFVVVRGNHDHEKTIPYEYKMTIGKRHILCTHGNAFDEETLDEVMRMGTLKSDDIMSICMETLYHKLAAYAVSKGCDTLFFGHTHHQVCTIVDGVTLVNPGSLCFGTPHSGYAIVAINKKVCEVRFFETRGLESVGQEESR